jgi:hypothetical protein
VSCREKKLISHNYSHAPQHIKSLAGYDDLMYNNQICTLLWLTRLFWLWELSIFIPMYIYLFFFFLCYLLQVCWTTPHTLSSGSLWIVKTTRKTITLDCKDNAQNKGPPYSSHNTRDSAVNATTIVVTKGGFRLLAPQQASIRLRMMSPFITGTSSTLQCLYQYLYQYLYHHHYYSIWFTWNADHRRWRIIYISCLSGSGLLAWVCLPHDRRESQVQLISASDRKVAGSGLSSDFTYNLEKEFIFLCSILGFKFEFKYRPNLLS